MGFQDGGLNFLQLEKLGAPVSRGVMIIFKQQGGVGCDNPVHELLEHVGPQLAGAVFFTVCQGCVQVSQKVGGGGDADVQLSFFFQGGIGFQASQIPAEVGLHVHHRGYAQPGSLPGKSFHEELFLFGREIQGKVSHKTDGCFIEKARGFSLGVPMDFAPERIGGFSGDSRPFQGSGVYPGPVGFGVKEKNGTVGEVFVQGLPVGQGLVIPENVIPVETVAPELSGIFIIELFYHKGGFFLRPGGSQIRVDFIHARQEKVGMAVVKPGHDHPVFTVHHPGLGA